MYSHAGLDPTLYFFERAKPEKGARAGQAHVVLPHNTPTKLDYLLLINCLKQMYLLLAQYCDHVLAHFMVIQGVISAFLGIS